MKDLKYLGAYVEPALCLIGLIYGGWLAFAGVAYAFIMVPLLEPVLPASTKNFTKAEKSSRLSNQFFDVLLFLNIPIVYGIIALFALNTSQGVYSNFELYGLVLSIGTLLSSNGINVAHEIGHRKGKWNHIASQILLLPNHYMHFFIEHNRGHHKRVATLEDPATSRYNENVYAFWIRSTRDSYLSAWQLESERLKQRNLPFWSLKNKMLVFTAIQLAYLASLWIFFGFTAFLVLFLAGINGFLLLETVNYIEHYGLLRKKLPSGKYERVLSKHSWNSNHELGRIMLYELTRHSDHHYMASKKYQVLDHHEDSPQLPMGYPGSMLMSLIPPLWFKVMNPKLEEFKQQSAAAELAIH